jgi:hypothetical protein
MHTVGSATPYAPRNDLETRLDTGAERLVRSLVRDLLERSPAFQALSADGRQALAANMVSVATYLAEPAGLAKQANDLLHDVNFPAFVAGLINGVFNAAVSASIKQMEAYGDLLKAVAGSIDHFVSDNVTDARARDYLTQHYPDLVPRKQDNTDTLEALCHRPLVASMLTLGIGRITRTAQ